MALQDEFGHWFFEHEAQLLHLSQMASGNDRGSSRLSILAISSKEMKLPERHGRTEVKILYYGSDLEKPMKQEVLRQD